MVLWKFTIHPFLSTDNTNLRSFDECNLVCKMKYYIENYDYFTWMEDAFGDKY